MKKILLLLLLAGGGVFGYRYAVVDAPVRACREFLRAWAKEDTPAAAAMTEGETAKKAVETRILRGVCRAPMEALGGSRATLESRSAGPAGEMVLTMRQVVAYDPPGQTSGFASSMAASFRHAVTMKKTAAGWKVAAFEPKFLEAVPTRRR
ncbi:MAG: hypothetical protein ABW056_12530 [Thermoanaerobaculia bacterium]